MKSPDVKSGRRDWMSLEECADYLKVCPRTIRRMIASGDVKAYRSGKRLIRIDRGDLDACLVPVPAVRART